MIEVYTAGAKMVPLLYACCLVILSDNGNFYSMRKSNCRLYTLPVLPVHLGLDLVF